MLLALLPTASASDAISSGSAVDGAGNVYVVGRFSGVLAEGAARVAARGGTDVFVMKLGPRGEPVWLRALGGPGDDDADSVSVSTDGLVVTGTFTGTLTVGDATHAAAGRGMFLARLDADGAPLWSRAWASESAPEPEPVTHGQLRVLLMAGGWANVWLDGRKLEATAPLASYALLPGTYEVRLENPFSGLSVDETVEVRPGKTTTVFARRF